MPITYPLALLGGGTPDPKTAQVKAAIAPMSAKVRPPVGMYSLPTTTALDTWLNSQTGVDLSGNLVWNSLGPISSNYEAFGPGWSLLPTALNGLDALTVSNNRILLRTGDFGIRNRTKTVYAVVRFRGRSILLGDSLQPTEFGVGFDYQENIASNQVMYADLGGFFHATSPELGVTPGTVTGAIWAIYVWRQNNNDVQMWQGGTLLFDDVTGNDSSEWDRVGFGNGSFINLDITDLIGYGVDHSDAQINSIAGAILSDRYNLPWTSI